MLTKLELRQWKMAAVADGVVDSKLRIMVFKQIEEAVGSRVKWTIRQLLQRILKEEIKEAR